MSDLYRQIARLNALLRRGALSEAQWYAAVGRAIREHCGVEK
jgi:hypothetical protein